MRIPTEDFTDVALASEYTDEVHEDHEDHDDHDGHNNHDGHEDHDGHDDHDGLPMKIMKTMKPG